MFNLSQRCSASAPGIGVSMYRTDTFSLFVFSFPAVCSLFIHNPKASCSAPSSLSPLTQPALQADLAPLSRMAVRVRVQACPYDCFTPAKNRPSAIVERLRAYPLRFVNHFSPEIASSPLFLPNAYSLELYFLHASTPNAPQVIHTPNAFLFFVRCQSSPVAFPWSPTSDRPTRISPARLLTPTSDRPTPSLGSTPSQLGSPLPVFSSVLPTLVLFSPESFRANRQPPNACQRPTLGAPCQPLGTRPVTCLLKNPRSLILSSCTNVSRSHRYTWLPNQQKCTAKMVQVSTHLALTAQRGLPPQQKYPTKNVGLPPQQKYPSKNGWELPISLSPLSRPNNTNKNIRQKKQMRAALLGRRVSGGWWADRRSRGLPLTWRRRGQGHETSITCPLTYIHSCFSWLCKPFHSLCSLSIVPCSFGAGVSTKGGFLAWELVPSATASAAMGGGMSCKAFRNKEVATLDKIHVVNAGVDTFVVNAYYLDDQNQPVRRRELDADFADRLNGWKQQAQDANEPYPTDFSFRDAQLLMLPNGAGRGQWQWMLKTSDITLYISRGLWNGIASVRLNSEFLWARPTLAQALVDIHALLYEVFDRTILHLQPSSVDLCADIAGWEDVEKLNKKRNFVSHSRKRRHDTETDPHEGLKASDHSYGLCDTGFDFSSRGPMSLTIYDKTRYIKQDGKTWFLPLWELHGWDPEKEPAVWRVEAKFKREVLRDLTWQDEHGIEDAYDVERLLPLLWAYAVGHVGGGTDGLPDGWLRCVRPGKDSNRARWINHPVWDVVQTAFTLDLERPAHYGAIIRKAKEEQNVEKALAAILGYATSLSAWVGGPLASADADLSIFLHWLAANGQDHLEKKERDFALEVLKKRVKIGRQKLDSASQQTSSHVKHEVEYTRE